MRITNAFFFIAFALSASVQLNDPDPWAWLILYATAACCCAAFHFSVLPWQVSAIPAVIAALWCLWLLPQFFGQVSMYEISASITMQTKAIEEAREAGGCLLVILWMSLLCWHGYRKDQVLRAEKSETGT